MNDWPFSRSETVCFSGHRTLFPEQARTLVRELPSALSLALDQGKRVFLCGGALGFDTLAAQAVLRLRREHPEVRLVIAAPCPEQSKRWAAKDQAVYRRILSEADRAVVVSESYYSGCMLLRNRFMVDASSLLICYVTRFRGGSWYTARYAMDQQLPVVNLAISGWMRDGLPPRMKEDACSCISISPSVFENADTATLPRSPSGKVRMPPMSASFFRKQSSAYRM